MSYVYILRCGSISAGRDNVAGFLTSEDAQEMADRLDKSTITNIDRLPLYTSVDLGAMALLEVITEEPDE